LGIIYLLTRMGGRTAGETGSTEDAESCQDGGTQHGLPRDQPRE